MSEGIWAVSAHPRSQKTHQLVLNATNELLRDSGFTGVTIERLAALSGVSTATIYKHWPSKNAIVAEAFGRTATEALKIPDGGDPLTDLVDFAVASLTFHSIESGRVFFQLLAACSMEPSGALYFQEYYMGPRRETMIPLFNRAIDAGAITPEVDVNVAMDVIFGATVFRLMRDSAALDAATIRKTIELSVKGLLTEKRRAHLWRNPSAQPLPTTATS